MSSTRLKGNINRIIIKGTLIQHEGPEWNREERNRRVNPQWVEERDIAFGTGYSILSGYIPMYPED